MSYEFQQFLPVGLLLIMAALFALANIALPSLVGKMRSHGPVKDTAYECGMPAAGGTSIRFSVKFYLVAMLFILFDVEAAFMLPWAVTYKQLPWTFWAMLSFMATLLVGFIYSWGKGALDWER